MKTPCLNHEIEILEILLRREDLTEFGKKKLIEFKLIQDYFNNLIPNQSTELSINPVVQQRELLEAFKQYINLKYDFGVGIDDYDIECFIEGLQ